jgi:hypothetical protein
MDLPRWVAAAPKAGGKGRPVARKCTGKPGGRPRIPLRRHPFRWALAFADAVQFSLGKSQTQAHLLAAAVFFATSVDPIPIADLPKKMRAAFKQGDVAVAYTLPSSGNPKSTNPKERMQAIDTLNKMSVRYSRGRDLAYRTNMAALMSLVMFDRGNAAMRRQMIEVLVQRLGAEDPEVSELARLIKT